MAPAKFYIGSEIFTYTFWGPRTHMNLTLPVMDIETQEPIFSLPVNNELGRGLMSGIIDLSIAISPDDTLLAISSDIGEVQIWNINTCQMIQQLTLDNNERNRMGGIRIREMEFSPDGSMLAILSLGGIRRDSAVFQIPPLVNPILGGLHHTYRRVA